MRLSEASAGLWAVGLLYPEWESSHSPASRLAGCSPNFLANFLHNWHHMGWSRIGWHGSVMRGERELVCCGMVVVPVVAGSSPAATPRLQGPVAQWTERQPSKLRAEVRLLPGPLRPQRRMVDKGARSGAGALEPCGRSRVRRVFEISVSGERGRERRGGAPQPPSPGNDRGLILGESSSAGRPASPLPLPLESPALRARRLAGGRHAVRLSGRGRHVGCGGTILICVAGVAKLANAPGLGPGGAQAPWGFESLRPHPASTTAAVAHSAAATMAPDARPCRGAAREQGPPDASTCRRTTSSTPSSTPPPISPRA